MLNLENCESKRQFKQLFCPQQSSQQANRHSENPANQPTLADATANKNCRRVLDTHQLVPGVVKMEQMVLCYEIDSQLRGRRSGVTSSIINGGALSVQLDKSLNMTPG